MTYSKFRPNQKPKNGKFKGKNDNRIERKKQVVFDLEKRKEFLTGFHKRKLAKKAKYRTMIERKVAQEKQRIKEKVLNSTTKTTSSDSILPEVEELLKREEEEKNLSQVDEFSVGSKTVVISTLNPLIKPLPDEVDEELNEDNGLEGEGEEEESSKKAADRKLVSKLKKSANSMLQASKFFKASQRLKCKKNKRKMQVQNRKAGTKPVKDDKKGKDTASSSKKGGKGGNKFSKGKGGKKGG